MLSRLSGTKRCIKSAVIRCVCIFSALFLALYHTEILVHLATEPHIGGLSNVQGVKAHDDHGHGHGHHHHGHSHNHDGSDAAHHHGHSGEEPGSEEDSKHHHHHAASDHLVALFFTAATDVPEPIALVELRFATWEPDSLIISALCESAIRPRAPPEIC